MSVEYSHLLVARQLCERIPRVLSQHMLRHKWVLTSLQDPMRQDVRRAELDYRDDVLLQHRATWSPVALSADARLFRLLQELVS